MQSYPVVQYETPQYIVTSTGTYNMIGDAGDTLDILYNPDHPTSFRINTPFWLWLDIWSWYRVLLVFIAFYYILRFLVRKTLPNQQQGIINDAS